MNGQSRAGELRSVTKALQQAGSCSCIDIVKDRTTEGIALYTPDTRLDAEQALVW